VLSFRHSRLAEVTREQGTLDVKYEENLDGKRKEKAQERKEKAKKTEGSLFGRFGSLVTTSLPM